ncbi:MAG: hydrogenase expression/formation protein HypE [Candidatus Omnitrophota bacterium]
MNTKTGFSTYSKKIKQKIINIGAKGGPDWITLSHGSGGRLSHSLIRDLFLKELGNPVLNELGDSALINYREPLAFTTDSFVVSPLSFSGADIGRLAVCGTVNDLVMQGAQPQYLSLAFIIEEGLDYRALERVVRSVSLEARRAGVLVATGDTKVVERGACDKLFINTSGIGRIIRKRRLSLGNIRCGDRIIVTSDIGRHGLAVLAKRKELDLGFNIKSDCNCLNGLIVPLLQKTGGIRFMRDPTRGGLAGTLNEIAEGSHSAVIVEEKNIPVSAKVRAAGELLGIDPLYIANEGAAVIVVEKESAKKVLSHLKKHPLGRRAKIIGAVSAARRAQVILNTAIGTQRIMDMLTADPLPRIC